MWSDSFLPPEGDSPASAEPYLETDLDNSCDLYIQCWLGARSFDGEKDGEKADRDSANSCQETLEILP
jgi:hypothetical protein